MKKRADILLIQRLSRSDDYPFVVELLTKRLSRSDDYYPFMVVHQGRKQTHRFCDSHQREEFVLGVRATCRLLGQHVDEEVR